MALQKSTTTETGFSAPNAYYRVCRVSIEKKTTLSFSLSAHTIPDLPAFELSNYVCAYDIAGENPIKQAYEHLKTLPEFAGAADV